MPGSADVQTNETEIELNYRPADALFSLMPNVQYVIESEAITAIPNAFVLGLRVQVTF
jgi:carbohydrate-selective porin OprB